MLGQYKRRRWGQRRWVVQSGPCAGAAAPRTATTRGTAPRLPTRAYHRLTVILAAVYVPLMVQAAAPSPRYSVGLTRRRGSRRRRTVTSTAARRRRAALCATPSHHHHPHRSVSNYTASSDTRRHTHLDAHAPPSRLGHRIKAARAHHTKALPHRLWPRRPVVPWRAAVDIHTVERRIKSGGRVHTRRRTGPAAAQRAV